MFISVSSIFNEGFLRDRNAKIKQSPPERKAKGWMQGEVFAVLPEKPADFWGGYMKTPQHKNVTLCIGVAE